MVEESCLYSAEVTCWRTWEKLQEREEKLQERKEKLQEREEKHQESEENPQEREEKTPGERREIPGEREEITLENLHSSMTYQSTLETMMKKKQCIAMLEIMAIRN